MTGAIVSSHEPRWLAMYVGRSHTDSAQLTGWGIPDLPLTAAAGLGLGLCMCKSSESCTQLMSRLRGAYSPSQRSAKSIAIRRMSAPVVWIVREVIASISESTVPRTTTSRGTRRPYPLTVWPCSNAHMWS
ncbi:MAG: hypothetical protein RL701_7659 [Pseudomonadota bacterium]